MRAYRRVLPAFSALVLTAALSAQTTWTGAASTSWDNPFNWSPALVPGPANDVVIAPAVNQPSGYIFNPTCASLEIQPGASVTLAPGFDLDVNGDLLVQGTLAVLSGSSDVTVAGGFTNNGVFSPGGATVDLNGAGVLAGSAATIFEDLVISGGVRSAVVDFTVNGDATVTSAGKLDLSAGTAMLVRGNWTSSAAGASTTGAGTVEFEGTGSLTTGQNGLPNVSILAGTRSINPSKVTGNLTQSGGTVTLLDNATLLVQGSATLSGGTFGFQSLFAGFETLDVNGDASITCSGGAFSADVRILCGGNWTSNASFSPTAGSVELDGIGLRTLSGAGPAFFNLRVASGTVRLLAPIAVGGILLIDTAATLDAEQAVDVAGSAVLGGATAQWDLNGLVHTVGANWTSAGGSAVSGTIRFDGPGTITAGSGAIANVVVDAAGVRNTGSVSITGKLELVSGELRIADAAVVSVGGDALLIGGVLSYNDTTGANEILDVQGSISALGTTAGTFTVGSQIHCAGNWVSGGTFAPTQGIVRFDGVAAATLSGAPATFNRVRVVSGVKTFSTPVNLIADLQLDPGATLNANAAMDVAGLVALGAAGGTWNLGGLTHRVGGNLSTTGSTTQNGVLALDGPAGGTVSSSGGGSFSALRVVSGARTFSSTAIAGDLTVAGGAAALNTAAILSVNGSAALSGGTLSLGATSRLDVAHNVTFSGTTAAGIAPGARIEFDGTWTGAPSWAPTNGLTAYTGGAGGVIAGSTSLYSLAVESGSLTVTGTLGVSGNLTLGGAFTTSAPLSIGGDVGLGASIDWNLGGQTHTVAGDWVSLGADATNGTIVFTGNGNLALGAGTLDDVVIAGGLRNAFGGTLTGDLGVTGGALRILQDQTLIIQGSAAFSGGLVGWFPVGGGPDEVLQVEGDVICNAGVEFESPGTRFVCRGDWSSNATFAPSLLRVVLDGPAPSTIGGTPRFHDLLVQNSARALVAPTLITGSLELSSAGSLNASAAVLDVDGSVTVSPGSTLNLGALNHTVAGDWTASGGAVIGTGVLEFNGSGTLSTGVTGSISNALISAGTRKVQTSVITGTLSMTGGTLELLNDQVLTVNGLSQLTGGVLAFTDSGGLLETLDSKDVVLSATAGAMNANSIILCSGNWSSTSAWSPAAGAVLFDGSTSATIGGASPTFHDVVVLSGSKTLTSPALVGSNLSVFGGHTLTTNAPLEVEGGVALLPGSTWNTGAVTHVVHGDWLSTGASVNNSAVLELAGDGQLTTGASTIPAVRVTGGTRAVNTSTIRFNLEQTGGTLLIRDNQTLTVQDDVLLTAGTLSFAALTPGAEVLLVEGNVLGLSATAGATSADALIEARGNWTSSASFNPASGLVRLAPAVAATLSGASPAFSRLELASGSITAITGLSVSDALTVASGAIFTTQAAIDVNGDIVLGDATAAWDIGSVLHAVAGDWTSSGGSATGAGFIAFDGPGLVATGSGTLPNVRVVTGLRGFQTSKIAGNLELQGGTLRVVDDAVLHVAGNVGATGGTLSFQGGAPGQDVLDVDGGFTAAGALAGTVSSSSVIRCAGNWNSSGVFAPAAGTIELDGAGATTISGAGLTLPKVLIKAGSKTANQASLQSLEVANGANLTCQGSLDVAGAVVLGNATASFNLGGLTHHVGGSWTSAGANATNGTIDFDGTGTLETGAASIANATITAGTRTARTSAIAGTLVQSGGALLIDADQTLSVAGNTTLVGGSLGFFATAAGQAEVLDIGGDAIVRLAAGTSSAGSVIRCAGNWASNSTFDLANGAIELDGAAPTLIGGLAPGFDPTFPLLVVRNGVRSAGGDFDLIVDQLGIEAGATLDAGAFALDVPQGLAAVGGTLSVGAGGRLGLGGAAIVLVSSTGTLRVRGTLADPAAVAGAGGGGYLLAVDGTLDAENFRFEQMGSGGVTVTQLATVTELRGGVFSHPAAAPGSVLLDIRRPAPAVFSYVDFEDPLLVGGKNVRTLGGAPIDFANSEGSISGPAFEIDPLGLVDWIDQSSTVTSFKATGGADIVNLNWTTSSEFDAAAWVVERATAPGGPFGYIGELPAAGPSSYVMSDPAVVAKQTYHYRLMERKTHGEIVEHASSKATPWSTTPPANVLTVGPGGAFPTIQAAVTAATGPNPVITVAAGTYASFTINGGVPGVLRIYGDGSGTVQIDTTGGPVAIQNLGVASHVELSDLTIGSASSPNAGVVIQSCLGIVILDELVVHGGIAQPGIQASASTKLAVQRCAVDGTPGFQASQGTVALVGRGSLDEVTLSGVSNVRLAGVNPTPTVEAGSTLTTLPGVHADLAAPEFLSLGTTFTLTYSGELGGIYALAYSASFGWFDLPSPFEMVGLLNLAQAPILATGILSAPSVQQTFPVPADGAIFGATLATQLVVVNPVTLKFRWSNVVTLVPLD